MKTKRLSLVILSLLTVLCLAFGVMFLVPKLDVVQAEGETIVVEDNFKDITTTIITMKSRTCLPTTMTRVIRQWVIFPFMSGVVQ